MTQNNKKPFITTLLAFTLAVSPTLAFASDALDKVLETQTTAPSETTLEPTPLEDFGNSENQTIPGTEPLYDQGVTITQVEIDGNEHIPDDELLGAIETLPGTVYNKRRLKQDLENIYNLGWFTENMRAVPTTAKDGIHIKYEVHENPMVKDFVVEGNKVIESRELLEPFDKLAGKPQNIKAINEAIKGVEKDYQDKGYVLTRVDGIDQDEDGTVVIKVNEGKLHKITFQGNKKTKDFVIRRAMAQKEGEVYNEKTVQADMKRIFSTQTVSDVRRVVKASTEVPDEYDLVIETDEKKTGTVSLGGGLDTGTGVFGSAGYNDPNFMGRGYNLSVMGSVGSGVIGNAATVVRRRTLQFQTSFYNPSLFETKNSLGTQAYARQFGSFNVPYAIESRYGGGVTLGRPLESIPNTAASLGLSFESIHLSEGYADRVASHGVSTATRKNQLEGGSFVYLDPSIYYDSRNNRFDPNSGYYISLADRVALGFGGQSNSYSNVTGDIRRYMRVTDNTTFAIQGRGGYNYLGNIPDFNKFRMGGPFDVRGFQVGSLGIGDHYMMGSAEIRTKVPFLKKLKKYPIYDMLQVAMFADAGQLFGRGSTDDNYGRRGFGASAGLGIRLNLPYLGPLRFDFGVPIAGARYNVNNINFGVGQKF